MCVCVVSSKINIFNFSLLIVSFFSCLYSLDRGRCVCVWASPIHIYDNYHTHTHCTAVSPPFFLLKRSIKIKIVSYNKTPINNTNNAAVNSSMTLYRERETIYKVKKVDPIINLTHKHSHYQNTSKLGVVNYEYFW